MIRPVRRPPERWYVPEFEESPIERKRPAIFGDHQYAFVRGVQGHPKLDLRAGGGIAERFLVLGGDTLKQPAEQKQGGRADENGGDEAGQEVVGSHFSAQKQFGERHHDFDTQQDAGDEHRPHAPAREKSGLNYLRDIHAV